MYWWRIESLKRDLRAPLPPKLVYRYAVGQWLLVTVCIWLAAASAPAKATAYDHLLWLLTATLVPFGFGAAYRANGSESGKDLAGRLLSLCWVISWRLLPVCVALGIVLAVVDAVKRPTPTVPYATGVLDLLVALATQVLYYWQLSKHLVDIHRRYLDEPQAEPSAA